MGFKVIESDEEVEAALAAGLLWMNESAQWPRPMSSWRRCGSCEHPFVRIKWEDAKGNKKARRRMSYLPEDFAVLVEEEDDSL